MKHRQSQIAARLVAAHRFCLWLGGLGLLVVGSVYIDAWLGAKRAVAAFEAAASGDLVRDAYEDAGSPVALLSIPRLGLEVPVFVGTDQRTLNHGAGIVDGTALPGATGNTVISAHRDSFFRPLKGIAVGDAIELRGLDGLQHFQVGEIFVTDPLDVSVLEPAEGRMLTLVTCYPFGYVGFAPDRLIVRARPRPRDAGLPAGFSNQVRRTQ